MLTDIMCCTKDCHNNLTEADVFYTGRFCKKCCMSEVIIVRAVHLRHGDLVRLSVMGDMFKVCGIVNGKIGLCATDMRGNRNGNYCHIGKNSIQYVYLFPNK